MTIWWAFSVHLGFGGLLGTEACFREAASAEISTAVIFWEKLGCLESQLACSEAGISMCE